MHEGWVQQLAFEIILQFQIRDLAQLLATMSQLLKMGDIGMLRGDWAIET